MALVEILREICSLQPEWSSENTPSMQRRGYLVRTGLRNELEARLPLIRPFLEEFADDLIVEASDGIGRKTEAPWVRLASARMSPSAREGFYLVIHFSRDGSAFWITIGFGSTVWANGELRPIADDELSLQRLWAQEEIAAKFGTLAPFEDVISLGASANLPRVFEKATVVARRVAPDAASESFVEEALIEAARRLVPLYRGQVTGANLTSAQQTEIEIQNFATPARARSSGQGFGLSGAQRKAIELQAMEVARLWLDQAGYTTKDYSANSPFDFLASRDGRDYKVEVKGTTSAVMDAFVMTRNEVYLHISEQGDTILILVSGIGLKSSLEPPIAEGGKIEVFEAWDIREFEVEPIAYRVRRS